MIIIINLTTDGEDSGRLSAEQYKEGMECVDKRRKGGEQSADLCSAGLKVKERKEKKSKKHNSQIGGHM